MDISAKALTQEAGAVALGGALALAGQTTYGQGSGSREGPGGAVGRTVRAPAGHYAQALL